MQLLTELYGNYLTNTLITESCDMLFEDLGTLKEIDPQLLKAMKTTYYKSMKAGNDGKDNSGYRQELAKTLGKSSPLKTTEIKNIKSAFAKFTDPDNKAIGIVFRLNGDQIFALSDYYALSGKYQGFKDSDAFLFSIQKDKFQDVVGKEAYKTLSDKIWFNSNKAEKIDKSSAYSIINAFIKAAKINDAIVDAILILADTERMKLKSDRVEAKRGSIPSPKIGDESNPLYTQFIKNAKYELKSKLDAYKASKASKFTTNEELLKSMVDSGFAEKFNLNGIVYKYYDSRLRFEMKSGRGTTDTNWQDKPSYIEYRFDENANGKKAKEFREIADKLYDEMIIGKTSNDLSKEDKEKMYKEFKKVAGEVIPPKEIRINLTMKGGSIIPGDVEFGANDSFY